MGDGDARVALPAAQILRRQVAEIPGPGLKIGAFFPRRPDHVYGEMELIADGADEGFIGIAFLASASVVDMADSQRETSRDAGASGERDPGASGKRAPGASGD